MHKIVHIHRVNGQCSILSDILPGLFYDASLLATPSVVLGDFNIHYDDAKQSEPLRMLLRSFNLIQHVDVATHQCGHTLDLVIKHDDDDLLSSVTVTPDSLSDHHRVEVKLNAYIPPPRNSTICRRSFKRMDVNALTDDITAACAVMCDCTAVTRHSVEQLTSRYNVRLVDCLDKHAPLTYQWRLRSVDFICQHLFYTTHGLYFFVIL